MKAESAIEYLVEKAIKLDKFSIARLVSLFEKEPSEPLNREEIHKQKQKVMELLRAQKVDRAFIAGVTGPPGAGKSTLVGALANRIIATEDFSLAIVAVDPSSHISGGALLGDRTRVNMPLDENRLYFRSQASELNLGGLGRHTFSIVNILSFLFDYVLVETVGIGQNEIEIRNLADKSFLVVQPFSGDQVQFLKAGVMEVPDAFIINKCDEESLAQKSYYQLKSSLGFLNIPAHDGPPIFMTSATSGRGIEELAGYLISIRSQKRSLDEKAQYFISKAIERGFGEFGLDIFRANLESYDNQKSYEENLQVFLALINGKINQETR